MCQQVSAKSPHMSEASQLPPYLFYACLNTGFPFVCCVQLTGLLLQSGRGDSVSGAGPCASGGLWPQTREGPLAPHKRQPVRGCCCVRSLCVSVRCSVHPGKHLCMSTEYVNLGNTWGTVTTYMMTSLLQLVLLTASMRAWESESVVPADNQVDAL